MTIPLPTYSIPPLDGQSAVIGEPRTETNLRITLELLRNSYKALQNQGLWAQNFLFLRKVLQGTLSN